jgi:hypothetical protein
MSDIQQHNYDSHFDDIFVAIAYKTQDLTNASQMKKASAENGAFSHILQSLANARKTAELVRYLNQALATIDASSPMQVVPVPPRAPGDSYFSLTLVSADKNLDASILVSNGTADGKRSIGILVRKAPVRAFKKKVLLPLNPSVPVFWARPVMAVAKDIFKAIRTTVEHLVKTSTQTHTQETDVSTVEQKEATAGEGWQLEWDPKKTTDEGNELDVLDYEDEYDDFVEGLDHLITSLFGESAELKLRAHVVAGEGEKDRTKIDILTGHKGQDLIDTFLPSGDKTMKFAARDGKLVASVSIGDKPADEFEFTPVSDEEATADTVVIGKWEFLEKMGLKKPASFKDLGIVRPKDYATFFSFMSKVIGTPAIATQAKAWIEAQRNERLPGLDGWEFDFRGNAQSPMFLIGNGKSTYALIFKKNEVSFAQSVGNRATPMGRWTWEDRCSRLSCAAVLVYLIRTVSSRISGEYQLQG